MANPWDAKPAMSAFTQCVVAMWVYKKKHRRFVWVSIWEPWHKAKKSHADLIAKGVYAVCQPVEAGFIPKPTRKELAAFRKFCKAKVAR